MDAATTITIYQTTYREHVAMSYVYGMEDVLSDTDPNRARWLGHTALPFGKWFAEHLEYDQAALLRAWKDYRRKDV